MSLRDLREKYQQFNGSKRAVVNKAIRAEIPGGNETLDAIELFHKIVLREGDQSVAQVAHDRLSAIAQAMEDEIFRRYTRPQ